MPSPETVIDAVPDTAAELDARYGRTPGAKRLRRWMLAAAAAAFAVVFALWLVWGGLLGAPAQFEARDTGHTIVSDRVVDVSWQFSVPPDTPARCALQAMNATFAIVGWKIVDIPASPLQTRAFTVPVLTSELAVTGLIYRCWLT